MADPKKKLQRNPTQTPNVNENVNVNSNVNDKEVKHCHGEYKHVRLTDAEYKKLAADYDESIRDDYIRRLDEYIQSTGKTYKDHNLTIRQWIRKAGVERGKKNTEQRADYEKVTF